LRAEIIIQLSTGKEIHSSSSPSLKESVEYVVMTDADYTYPAEYLPDMIEILEQIRR
jgi:hypothetical protein